MTVSVSAVQSGLDLLAISRALDFAAFKHRNQRRKDKAATPYINHPLQVFGFLVQCGVRDTDILVAAILHDTIEDTDTTADEIRALFGEQVLAYVLELTDDKSLEKAERKRLQVKNAPHKSAGAKQIKIGDKIANISDLASAPPDGWDRQRVEAYLQFAAEVVAGCRGINPDLDRLFDERLTNVRTALIGNSE